MYEITKNMIRILGRSFLKEFVCNKVVGFKTSVSLKVNFFSFTFQGFFQLLRNTYFKECILTAASTIYLFKLFLLSCKLVRKSVGPLRKFQIVLPRTFKLFVRPHYDHGHIIYNQAHNFVFIRK